MPKMIRVRSKLTGLETQINELAFGAFAAHYDRLDDDQAPTADEPDGAEQSEPPAEAAASGKNTRRTAAAKDKE
ncbi:hypothetical protein HD597_010090 [Nonomuraea thailandensis]|uniref:Uncharacterized protein n=1 Tax=Nonomuraea thailandensis TaxID=1188745 RepID=A0A9X2K7X7_9ACTN|nr:hypothetical protein [Nonomuraea thailandensis]MCP2363070.1 hypothetical protein [Nonomuraea thailandensis]